MYVTEYQTIYTLKSIGHEKLKTLHIEWSQKNKSNEITFNHRNNK